MTMMVKTLGQILQRNPFVTTSLKVFVELRLRVDAGQGRAVLRRFSAQTPKQNLEGTIGFRI